MGGTVLSGDYLVISLGADLAPEAVPGLQEAGHDFYTLAGAITGKGEPGRFGGEGECFIETGDGRAALGSGNFYAEPAPQIALRPPGRILHLGKVAYEKFWLYRWW